MAERLAPERADARITSRPERAKGRFRRWVRRFVAFGVAAVLVLAGAVVTAHFLTIHRSAQELRPTALVPPELPARVLVVIARPGQEVTMAGTLAALDRAGAEVALLSLTRGEAQPPAIDFATDTLPNIRADELARSAEILGVDSVVTAEYSDGGLLAADPATVTASIAQVIADTTPSVVLTVTDANGRDGDAQAVAAYALAASQADGSGVARVWTVTRGDAEARWRDAAAGAEADAAGAAGAVDGSQTPVEADPGSRRRLPEAQVAVRIDEATTTKGEALLAHGSQSPDLVRSTYPYADRLPAWLYFRFWDREYFALAWGAPLD